MATATVKVEQIGSTASKGYAHGHEVVLDRPEAKGGTNQGMMGGEAVLTGLGGLAGYPNQSASITST